MKRYGWTTLVLLIAGLCFAMSFLQSAGYDSTVQPEVIVSGMPVNTTITWYSSTSPAHARRVANASTIEMGIDVEIVRDSCVVTRDSLLSEIEQGTVRADVVNFSDIGAFIELRQRGHLLNYNSLHYTTYPPEFTDPGYWAPLYGVILCMAYDENQTDNPPQEWTDLLDPKWKGRIGLADITTTGSQYAQYYLLREKIGLEFWEKLLSIQEPGIYDKAQEMIGALLKGEIDIAGELASYKVYEYGIIKGTSIRGIYPLEGVPIVLNAIAVMNGTDQPEEAKAFLDFLLSNKGQEIMQSITYRYSLREDVSPIEGLPSFDNLNVLWPKDLVDYLQKNAEYIREFNDFIGAR